MSWPTRHFLPLTGFDGKTCVSPGGTRVVPVSSTNYLGLLFRPRAREVVNQAFSRLSVTDFTSLSSHYLGGSHPARIELEQRCSRLCGRNEAVAFNSGWAACYSIAFYVGSMCDVVISDIRSHNSTISGLRASGVKVVVCDVSSEEEVAQHLGSAYERVGVFFPSLSGTYGEWVRPAKSLLNDCRVVSVCDESHSIGVYSELGWDAPVAATWRVMSLSKAIASAGAIAVGANDEVAAMRSNAPAWVFSTPLPPGMWSLAGACVDASLLMSSERKAVAQLAQHFRKCAQDVGLDVLGDSHVSCLRLPANCNPRKVEQLMLNDGFFLRVSEYPTVARGQKLVRLSFLPSLTEVEVARFVAALARLRESGVRPRA